MATTIQTGVSSFTARDENSIFPRNIGTNSRKEA